MRLLFLAIVAAGGCGRLGFDAISTDAGGTPDAEVTGVFEGLELPPGGQALAFALAGNSLDRYYVAYAGGSIYRVDQGVWTLCASVPGDPFDIAVAGDGTLYVAHLQDVAVSTDQCASFVETGFPKDAYAIAATALDAYVGSYDGLWSYTHATNTWVPVTTAFDAALVNGIATSGSLIGVAADTGFSVYHNAAWHTVSTTPDRALRVVFDPTDATSVWSVGEAGIFHSTDSGDTFSNVVTGYFDTLAIDPTNGQHLLAMRGDALKESFDGGVTFGTEKRTEVMGNAWPTDAIFDPQGGGRALIAMENGVFLASDASLQWTRIDTTVHAWSVTGVGESPTTRYIATTGGAWSSENLGPWTLRNAKTAQSSFVSGLTVSRADPDRVYVMGDSLASSANRGADFSVLLPSAQVDGWGFERLVEHGARLWVGSFARLVYSDDSGANWNAADLGGVDHIVRGILVRANNTEVVVATEAGTFWSTNNGTSFVQSKVGFTDASLRGGIVELTDGRVLVATNDGIFAARIPSDTWTRVAFPGSAIHDLLTTPSGLIVAEQDGVFISRDGAQTFQELPGLSVRRPHTLSLGTNNTLLVGTTGHGVYRTPLP